MNNFGVNLSGKKAIYSKSQFYKPNATVTARTFICESGPGCIPDGSAGMLGLVFGARTISGRWEADNQRDTLDINSFDAYLDDAGKETAQTIVEEITEVAVALPRNHVPVAVPAQTKPATTPDIPKPPRQPRAVQSPTTNAGAAPVAAGEWNPDRIVELYKDGTKIVDIAVAMGYARGQGNNRVRAVLKERGVYKEQQEPPLVNHGCV